MKRYGIFFVLQIVLILFVYFGGKIILSHYSLLANFGNPITLRTIRPTPTPTPDPKRPFTVLLLGYGGGIHDGGTLTDSILELQINPKNYTIHMVSIPRDLYVPLPIQPGATVSAKINAAYPYGSDPHQFTQRDSRYKGIHGGGTLAKDMVSQVTGITVDYYIAVSFDGFVKAIDTLGGIDVNVTKPFTDSYYPIEGKEKETCGISDEEVKQLTATESGEILDENFTCRYEKLSFDKGVTHMDGTTALKYARSRHSEQNGGDFSRSERQRNVLVAVRDKIMSIGFLPKIIPLINSLGGAIDTDIGSTEIQRLLPFALEYKKYSITSVGLSDQNVLIPGFSPDGAYILKPKTGLTDWNSIQTFLKQQFDSTQSASTK